MNKKRSNLGLAVAVILGGVILIGVGIMRSDWNFYQTIAEVKRQGGSGGKAVRVVGEIEVGSWRPEGRVGAVSFVLTDGGQKLPVRYVGPAVSGQAGRQIVVEGSLDGQRVFQAKKILTKCESKYTVKTEGR